ncbi:MAG TPA: hypothetical protein PKE69_20535, partial [Pyrinomonadaceae bacterium]|nr:hypothetical protein [Pyrinomonadaceae bacterium]
MFNFSKEILWRHWFFIKLMFLMAAILLCGSIDAQAQRTRPNKKTSTKTVAKNVQTNKVEKTDNQATTDNNNFPVSVVNSSETDYLSGEA